MRRLWEELEAVSRRSVKSGNTSGRNARRRRKMRRKRFLREGRERGGKSEVE